MTVACNSQTIAKIFDGICIGVFQIGEGLVELCFDRRDDKVNKLDSMAVSELTRAIETLGERSDVRGLLITSRKDGFLAGADIDQLMPLLFCDESKIRAYRGGMADALTALSELPMPSVAAIHGFAMGGGLETALAADYRVISADARVGLPEVELGLIPGAGGTGRMPRLAGAAVALQWIVDARARTAAQALDASVVDAVAPPARLREESIRWLRDAIDGRLDWRARRETRVASFQADPDALRAARELAQRAGPHFPAAMVAVELIQAAADKGIGEALGMEADAFLKLAQTPAARALTMQFVAQKELRVRSRRLAEGGRAVGKAAVLGAGIMGGGIACVSAFHGVPVIMRDLDPRALDSGMGEADRFSRKQVRSGRLTQQAADAARSSITPTLELSGFGEVDLVIEAVVEKMEVKQSLLAEVEHLVRPGTVLASNTSSLSIGRLAQGLERPDDFVGMHFFNPVPMMPLVEIVKGPRSSQKAVATAVRYVTDLNKMPLVVKDCPGFLVNRLLGAYMFGFMRLMHDGVDFTRVDRVMEAFGWAMGPAHLQDVVGIDTLDKALSGIADGYSWMRLPFETSVQRLARLGRHGQKNGHGYYRYEADGEGRLRRIADAGTHRLLADIPQDRSVDVADDEIVDRLMLPMLLEAARCVQDQVAEGAAEIDAAMRLGAGFPRHLGGPLWYADSLGLAEVVKRSERYEALGELYVPADALRQLAAAGGRFYPFVR